MLTCLTCEVIFYDANLQIKHFQTEWHKYNLKRKVAELPPLKLEQYNERILALKAKEEEAQGPQNTYCEYCKKKFCNQNSFLNHSKSKKHLENVEKKKETPSENPHGKKLKDIEEDEEDSDDEDIEIEEVDSDEWEGDAIPVKQCLFCSLESKSLEANLKHMTKVHSFFIPDLQYCINLEGLIAYLGEKVGCQTCCLWCNGKGRNFWTVEAVQAHMEDKGHCMMKFEKEFVLEYADFYDYSSSYPDADDPNVNPDDVVEPYTISDNGYELVLPSGTVIGHRSLLRYYKQRLNPNRSLVLHKGQQSISMHKKMLEHYKSLGLKGSSMAEIVSKARDINYMKRIQSKQFMKLGVKGNKLQTHFRPQVRF
ncbi:Zinc finger protein [Armadillidium nasatum]|uniref:Zinc finger protein n=1 Tax=Armadillidium nasatum TaxID=96803 RepID=A0A5N5SJ66_9CRUS|nr:Zinc finger protein [Armadillidium nasatum]